MSAWLAKAVESIPMQLKILELSRPDRIVLTCLLTFFGGILAGAIVYVLVTTSLQLGRAMASGLGTAC